MGKSTKSSQSSAPATESAAPRKVALVVKKQSGDFPIYEDEYQRWDKTINELSKKYGVPANLVHSMMAQESEYGRSKKAGNNVLQMTAPAYAEINDDYARKKFGWTDSPKNSLQLQTPEQGLEAGVRYLAILNSRYKTDLNDPYATGRRFNGSPQKDSYGRNIQNMVGQFGTYQKGLVVPQKRSIVVSDPVLDPYATSVGINNIKVVADPNTVSAPIQIDWV